MNSQKPIPPIDDDIGPLDEHGQQIWSPEEEVAIARLRADPDYFESAWRANADIDAGHFYTQEQVVAEAAERRKRWREERGL